MEKKKKNIKKEEKKAKKLTVYNMLGSKVDELDIFFKPDNNHQASLAQVVNMYLANQRSGLASTKTRGEVSGGGKKPWRQKGTGRARVGSSRNPLWRHGGVVFGPHRRNYHYQLSPKIRQSALLEALKEKNEKGDILILDELKVTAPKTKEIKKVLDNIKATDKVLLVASAFEKNLQLAARNIFYLSLVLAKDLNALDILRNKKIIVLKEALNILSERLQ